MYLQSRLPAILCAFLFASTTLLVQLAADEFLDLRDLQFETLDTTAGLSNASVTAIVQDETGFLWIGTVNGLNRYEGRGFRSFRHSEDDPQSLIGNHIVSLFKDDASRIWIGTRDGISRFLPESESFANYIPNPNALPNPVINRVTAFAQTRSGQIYAATQEGALLLYDSATDTFKDLPLKPLENVRSMAAGPDATLFIGASNSIVAYDTEDETVKTTYLPTWANNDTGLKFVEDLERLDSNRLLVATSHAGVVIFNTENESYSQFNSISKNAWIGDLLIKDDSTVFATTSRGLFICSIEDELIIRYQHEHTNSNSIASQSLSAAYFDRQNNLWLGTERGLNKATARKPFYHYRPPANPSASISDTSASAIHTDAQGRLWVGYFSGHLDIFDPTDKRIVKSYPFNYDDPRSPAQGTIHFISSTSDGSIWVGSFEGGLRRYSRQTEDFERVIPAPYNDIRSIAEDASGNIWAIAHGKGLLKFNPASGELKRYSNDPAKGDNTLIDDWGTVIDIDQQGILWIGSGTGLCRFDPNREAFRNYRPQANNPNSLSAVPVYDLHIDASGRLWVGTIDGINLYDPPNEAFRTYRVSQDPNRSPNESSLVRSIEDSKQGEIWFSTDRGLYRLDQLTWSANQYDLNDGLRSRDFLVGSSHQSPEGRLYFGGQYGVTAFLPEEIERSTFSPAPIITEVANLNDPQWELSTPPHVEIGPLDFHYASNSLAFSFLSLNFANPESIRYRYRLIGFDNDWSRPDTSNKATYTNLAPGDYVFEVQASNSDGVWSPSQNSLAFMITSPYWSTLWFRSAAVLLLAGIIFSGHRIRISKIRVQREKLKHKVERRTKELALANDELASQREEIQRQNEELKSHKADLERRVEKRTNDLKKALGLQTGSKPPSWKICRTKSERP